MFSSPPFFSTCGISSPDEISFFGCDYGFCYGRDFAMVRLGGSGWISWGKYFGSGEVTLGFPWNCCLCDVLGGKGPLSMLLFSLDELCVDLLVMMGVVVLRGYEGGGFDVFSVLVWSFFERSLGGRMMLCVYFL